MTKQKTKISCGIVFAVYVIVNLILLYYHEPWRDEAQVWLLSRDLPLYKLPAQMAYEGHPCLWHVLMYPFAHFGLPYVMQSVIAFCIVSGAAWLLLRHSAFPFYAKVLLLFSPFFTYYYPVIARNYCLIPLFLCLLAYWYPTRMERPVRYLLVVALLVQSHAVMIMTAFALCLCYLIERMVQYSRDREGRTCLKSLCPLLLPLGSALFLLYELMNVQKSSLLHIKTASLRRTVEKILEKTAEGMGTLFGIDGRLGLALWLVGVLFLLLLLLKRGSAAKYTVFTVSLLTFCFQFWFYTMVYNYSMQRLMTYPLLIVWGMWIMQTEKRQMEKALTGDGLLDKQQGEEGQPQEEARKAGKPSLGFLVFGAVCLLSIWHTLPEMRLEIEAPYSNGREAAAFIKESLPEDAVLLADNQAEVTAIFPYLKPVQVIYAPNGETFTYVTWDDHWMDRSDYASFRGYLETLDTGKRPVYLISCMGRSYLDGSEALASEFEMVYQSARASIKGEDYQIYRLR